MKRIDERAIRQVMAKMMTAPVGNEMTVEEGFTKVYWDRWRSNRDCDRQESHGHKIAAIIGKNRSLHDIDGQTISYLTSILRDQALAPGTINRYLSTILTMLNHVKDNYIPELVIPKIRLNRKGERTRERILTPNEEKELLEAADPLLRDFITVQIQSGLRTGELIDLTYERSINLRDKSITVFSKGAKSGKARTIPMSAKVFEVLSRRKVDGNGQPTHRPFDLTIHQVNRRFRILKGELGITDPDFCLYMLRHTCATRLAQNGIDTMLLMQLLGHSSPLVSQRYTHLSSHSLKGCIKLLDGM